MNFFKKLKIKVKFFLDVQKKKLDSKLLPPILYIEKYFGKRVRNNKDIALSFLKCSKIDIKSSKLLYNNKCYSNSIYLFQQSVEKALKGFLLGFGLIDENDLKNIGHHGPKAFLLLCQKSEFSVIISKLYPLNVDKINQFIKEMKKILKKSNKWAKKTKKEIKDYSSQWLKRKNKSDMDVLFILSLFTFPHFEFSRYPDGNLKPFDYNKKLGIVKVYPNFINELEKSVNSIINHIKKPPKLKWIVPKEFYEK